MVELKKHNQNHLFGSRGESRTHLVHPYERQLLTKGPTINYSLTIQNFSSISEVSSNSKLNQSIFIGGS